MAIQAHDLLNGSCLSLPPPYRADLTVIGGCTPYCGDPTAIKTMASLHGRNTGRLLYIALSDGIFAVALALIAGAERIDLSGFSFSGGHSYFPEASPRHNVENDKAALRMMAATGKLHSYSTDISGFLAREPCAGEDAR